MSLDDELLAAVPHARWALEFVQPLPWQPRPDGSDYRGHLMRVALRVHGFGLNDNDLVTAALLHDCIEDQSGALVERGYDTAEECISNEFGERVCELVKALTTEGPYADHVRKTMQTEAAPIKLADFLDNALALSKLTEPRRSKLKHKYSGVAQLMVDWLGQHPVDGRDDCVQAIRAVYPER
jgi:(p)ppGpp synthase/HD superfamily hydrolase